MKSSVCTSRSQKRWWFTKFHLLFFFLSLFFTTWQSKKSALKMKRVNENTEKEWEENTKWDETEKQKMWKTSRRENFFFSFELNVLMAIVYDNRRRLWKIINSRCRHRLQCMLWPSVTSLHLTQYFSTVYWILKLGWVIKSITIDETKILNWFF